MANWTLENFALGETSGVEKSFYDWGFGKLKRTRKSLSSDDVTFEHIEQNSMLSAPVLDPGSICVIKKDGVRWFFGIVLSIPARGNSSGESKQYKLGGPWWFLENKVYEQVWKTWWGVPGVNVAPDGIEGVDWMLDSSTTPPNWFKLIRTSHVILNQRINNGVPAMGLLTYVKISTGQQIYDALDWAISKGAPIAIGSEIPPVSNEDGSPNLILDVLLNPHGCPNADIPMDAVQDRTCGEIIKKQLLYAQNTVAFFDYTTSPYPTFHCKQRNGLVFDGFEFVDSEEGLVPVNISFNPEDMIIESLDVNPRYDLQVPLVKINYEYQFKADSNSWLRTFVDQAPDPLPPDNEQFAGLVFTVEMAGAQFNSTRANVNVTPIALEDPNFWVKFYPWLGQLPSGFTIIPGSGARGDGSQYLPNVLNPDSSAVAPWMNVRTQEETISCQVSFDGHDGGKEHTTLPLNITATDAISKTYEVDSYTSYAEPYPNALASFIYGINKHLQYEGKLVFVEGEVSGIVDMGNTLNITDGVAEWATMNAMVTSISEDVDEGRTTVSYGPAGHLGPKEFVELLRVNRLRKSGWAFFGRAGASMATTGVQFGDKSPLQNSTQQRKFTPVMVVQQSPVTFTESMRMKLKKLGMVLGISPSDIPPKITLDSIVKNIKIEGASDDGTVTMQLGTDGSSNTTQGHDIAFKQVCVTMPDGSKKSMIILGSEPY